MVGIQRLAVDQLQRPGPDPEPRFGQATAGTPVDQRVQTGVGERTQDVGEYLDGAHTHQGIPDNPVQPVMGPAAAGTALV